jgi:hypothetical protein
MTTAAAVMVQCSLKTNSKTKAAVEHMDKILDIKSLEPLTSR